MFDNDSRSGIGTRMILIIMKVAVLWLFFDEDNDKLIAITMMAKEVLGSYKWPLSWKHSWICWLIPT